MNNADEIKRKLNEAKNKDYKEAVSIFADITFEIGVDACHERHLLRDEIQNLRLILLGNGHPEKSIVMRMQEVERQMKTSCKSLQNIESALLGTVEGKAKGEQSLMDKISNWENFQKDFKKAKWIVYGIIITEVVALIIQLLVLMQN